MGFDKSVVMRPYDATYRKYRRLLKGGLNPDASRKYIEVQKKEITMYLNDLLDNPESFVQQFRKRVPSCKHCASCLNF
jgi:hypothetical protein